MKVRALTTFGGTDAIGNPVHVSAGDIFELPDGVDWLRAGLVVAIEEPEAATVEVPERATKAKPKRRVRRKKSTS